MIGRQQPLHIAVRQDKDSGAFVAHCLTLDLMECGNTPESAWQNLKGVIKAHLEYCYTHNQQGQERSAAQEDWDRYYESIRRNPEDVRVEQIQIELRPPTAEREIPLWILRMDSSHEATYI